MQYYIDYPGICKTKNASVEDFDERMQNRYIRESVDSLCRDETDAPIT